MLWSLWVWIWVLVLKIAPKDAHIGCTDECQYDRMRAGISFFNTITDLYHIQLGYAEKTIAKMIAEGVVVQDEQD